MRRRRPGDGLLIDLRVADETAVFGCFERREALALGLVTEVVPVGRSLERALELAQAVAAFPQLYVRSDWQAVYAGLGLDLAEGYKSRPAAAPRCWPEGRPKPGTRAFREGKR